MNVQIGDDDFPYPPIFEEGVKTFSEEEERYYRNLMTSEYCPAERLSLILTVQGCRISATTIRTWRRQRTLYRRVHSENPA